MMPDYRPDHRRYIYLYCTSQAQRNKLENLAEKAGTSLSKFLLNIIEEAISEQARAPPRVKVSESLKALEMEVEQLREESRLNSMLLKKYETENRRLRDAANFSNESFEGERRLDAEILAVIRRAPTHDYRLLDVLGTGPQDTEQIKAVHKQLEVLELHGLIRKEKQGWRWLGK